MSDAVDVSGLKKVYSANEGTVRAVDGVSFTVERGETVGVLGPNGAGKTTLIKCILGLVAPTAGSVSIHGVDPHESRQEAYRKISAVLEGARNVYWRLTVHENLRFFAGIQEQDLREMDEQFDRILSMLDLEDKKHEVARDLSRGMQQKLSLGCTLARNTPVVFLDEPTLGLDVEASRDLRSELQRLTDEDDRTVLMSSHDMEVIRDVCDRVIILNEGEVIANDDVESLLDVSDVPTYEFVVEGAEELERRLSEFDVEFQDCEAETTFRVTLPDEDLIYDLMDQLRSPTNWK